MGYSATGKGLSDSASRRASDKSSGGSSGSSGQADRPGEAEEKMRRAGVSESDIQRATGDSYGTPYHGSRRGGSDRSTGGKPDKPGEASQKMREAGVSERDIERSRSESSQPGRPDRPGEARQKMIDAGVMAKTGEMKNIIGHYQTPGGTTRFIAEGEPLPSFERSVPTPKPITDVDVERKSFKGLPVESFGAFPRFDSFYTSGTQMKRSIFDMPAKVSLATKFSKWYETQKTLIGMGGEQEAKEYSQLSKQFELSKITGAPFDTSKLETKYQEYEKAKGVSPLAGKGIKTRSSWGSKAHDIAMDVRSDKPTYGGWQGDLSRVINEALASTIEFGGSVPSTIRHGVPTIVKHPSLIVPLAAVSGIEMGKALKSDPIQTIATMAMTGAALKGAGKGIKSTHTHIPKPILKSGVVGIRSGKGGYRALFEPKSLEYMLETPKTLKGGSFKYPSKPSKPSVEAIKIEQLMPKPKSKQLVVSHPKTIIDVVKAQSHHDPHIRGVAKLIMAEKAIKIKAKEVSKFPIEKRSEIKYRQARREITKDIVREAQRTMMRKETIKILTKGDRFHAGLPIPDISLGKIGTRYSIKATYKEPIKSKYVLPSVKKQHKGVDVEGSKIDWASYRKPKVFKRKGAAIPFTTLISDPGEFKTPYKFTEPIQYKKSEPIKKSKKEYIAKSVPQIITLPKHRPFPDVAPDTLSITKVKYAKEEVKYIPVTPKLTDYKIPKEKGVILPAIPTVKKLKSKKKPVKKSRIKKEDIKNPIATVEQFMRGVTK